VNRFQRKQAYKNLQAQGELSAFDWLVMVIQKAKLWKKEGVG
jgi:hypothetical protein